ncbi:ArsR family transcriptional regulator [Desulfolutivibrio sp.]|uniref:ArsR family transcriptional regulator n=1 Tax=Desulfolutivibrio sp. TaxID=2773296 RepID=UPI002F967D2E
MGQVEEKSAQRIMDALGVKMPKVKCSLARLVMLDKKFYKITGMESLGVSGPPKIKKTVLHLGATLLKNYGFSGGDEFRFSVSKRGRLCWRRFR